MTDIVAPPTIDALPPGPRPTDTPAEFDSKGFATIQAQEAMVPQINAAVSATYQNAVATNERAVSAASSAYTATTQADAAMGYRNAAQTAATTATTKANEANFSAIAASKLNLGAKASAPSVDNQGAALQAGTSYYDTTVNRWRIWSGSVWIDGYTEVEGLGTAAYAALTTSLVDTTPGRVLKTGDFGVGGWLDFRLGDSYSTPSSAFGLGRIEGFCRGSSVGLTGDGSLCLSGNYPDGTGTAGVSRLFKGVGYIAYSYMLDASNWSPWVYIHHTGNIKSGIGNDPNYPMSQAAVTNAILQPTPVATSGGVMNCALGNYFTATISANTTLSFANIPAGAYSCVLEVWHTAGTITFPAGTVWSGVAPTLSPGRHMFFFQRTQLGTAGWYASSLAGYSA